MITRLIFSDRQWGSMVFSDKETQNSEFFQYVLEADDVIKQRFPYGAINQVDIAKGVSDEELKGHLVAFGAYERISNKNISRLSKAERKKITGELAAVTQPLLFGNCGMFTNYAIGYLKSKYAGISFECMFLDGHALLVIGRNPSSNPTECATWGNALICDLWAGNTYKATNFYRLRETSPDIRFHQSVVDDIHQSETTRLNPTHYLSGSPEIYVGPSAVAYDNMLTEWVAKDRAIRATPPMTPIEASASAPLAPINFQEIKDPLTILSKISGWKFSKQKNIAWVQCFDEQQAKRVAESLNASRLMAASTGKSAKDGTWIVQCEQFKVDKLKQSAELVTAKDGINLDQFAQIVLKK